MNRFLTGFSYLLFLNFELAIFLIGAVQGARFLNREFNRGFDWIVITVPISLLLCGYVVYRYLVFIVKSDQKKTKAD